MPRLGPSSEELRRRRFEEARQSKRASSSGRTTYEFYIDPALRDRLIGGIEGSGLLPEEWIAEAILAKLETEA